MAMQKPKIDPKNHVHWSLSTQMERMEMLVLPHRQQSVVHAKMQQLLSQTFGPELSELRDSR